MIFDFSSLNCILYFCFTIAGNGENQKFDLVSYNENEWVINDPNSNNEENMTIFLCDHEYSQPVAINYNEDGEELDGKEDVDDDQQKEDFEEHQDKDVDGEDADHQMEHFGDRPVCIQKNEDGIE